MTIEELQVEKAKLQAKIEEALFCFYDATRTIRCKVEGSFSTEETHIEVGYSKQIKRIPNVTINLIKI